MTTTKLRKALEKAFEKYGNITLVEYVDYWYRETYEGENDWKVREVLTLEGLLNSSPDPSTVILPDYDIRRLLQDLEKGAKDFPKKASITYKDSLERWEQMKRDHSAEERRKAEAFNALGGMFANPWYELKRNIF